MLRMPGSEQAVREPWRMAVAHIHDAQVEHPSLSARISHRELRIIDKLLESGFNAPWTSSAGRLFDAVAALIGLRDRVSYEGQAAITLEWLAESVAATDAPYEFDLTDDSILANAAGAFTIDTRPLIKAVATDVTNGVSSPRISRRFHTTVVEFIVAGCVRLRQVSDLSAVVLSGGVFMNAVLTCEVSKRLAEEGFQVHRQTRVPCNDGGLSLGQLAIAACAIDAPTT